MEGTMAGEEEPAQTLAQSLKMKKDQRTAVVERDRAVAKADAVVADVPRRKIGADVLDRLHPREARSKAVEITLVGKAVAVNIVVAPFDASFPPPADDSNAVRIVARPDPSDI